MRTKITLFLLLFVPGCIHGLPPTTPRQTAQIDYEQIVSLAALTVTEAAGATTTASKSRVISPVQTEGIRDLLRRVAEKIHQAQADYEKLSETGASPLDFYTHLGEALTDLLPIEGNFSSLNIAVSASLGAFFAILRQAQTDVENKIERLQ